jgi:enoyl-CoA hydratase/carnithine racemase
MSLVSLDERDGVTVVTADHPPANAMSLELLDELVGAARRLEAEPPPAVVLSGREGFFSAGVDLKAAPGYGADEQRRLVEGINAMALGFYGLSCPVVCAITGHAIAGGFVLALCGDHRVASNTGRYGLTEVKVSVPYPQAAIGVVRAELAPQAARLLVLGNRLIEAADCVAMGAFDEAVAPAEVRTRALEVARELAALPGDEYARAKRELRNLTLTALRAAVQSDPLLGELRERAERQQQPPRPAQQPTPQPAPQTPAAQQPQQASGGGAPAQ